VDEETETESIICGRGYGGVATFWRKSIDHAIKYYNDGNERINVITVNIKQQPLCIISVYMPSENSNFLMISPFSSAITKVWSDTFRGSMS
jgi:exonuclease III